MASGMQASVQRSPALIQVGYCSIIAMACCLASPAAAQVQLPEITVTAPSPVLRPRPAVPSGGPVAATPVPPLPAQLPEAATDVFVPLTVMLSREITAIGGANLADQLQYRPGISASTFAPGASRPVIRGLDNYRVSVRENGIGSQDVSALSEDHAVPIDPFAADQVEVVRGPATLRYGSGAIGGVVNATNQRIPDVIPRYGANAELRGGLGSVDRSFDGAFKVTAGAGNFAVHADAFGRRAEDYMTPNGRQFNSFVNNHGFSTGGSLIGREGFVGVAYTQFNALYGIPGAEAVTNRTRIDLRQDKVQSRGEWRVRDGSIEAVRFWLGGSTYAHNEIGFETGAAEVGARFENREIEGRVEVQHLPVATALGELRGAVGIQLGNRRTTGTSFEGDSLLDPAQTRTAAVFWFEELQATRQLRFQAALRVEQTSVSGVGLDVNDPLNPVQIAAQRTYTPFSGSFGALYQLPAGVVARMTGTYAERAPDAAELFSKGAHEATTTFEIGNPFLSKEVAKTWELGLKRAKGDLRFDASAYYTRFDGFIFKRRTGETCDGTLASCSPGGGGGELNQILFQQRDAAFWGAELSAQQDIGKVWRGIWGIDGQFDYVRAQFADATGGNVPRIPPYRAGLGIYYRDMNWSARTGFLHAFDQTAIGDNETETKGFTLLNADLSYTWKLEALRAPTQEMTIGLRGENLLDDDVRNHVSFQKDSVLQPGRSVRLYGVMKLN